MQATGYTLHAASYTDNFPATKNEASELNNKLKTVNPIQSLTIDMLRTNNYQLR